MGRKAKYSTEAQRREAKAKYDADYYSKNRRKILKKRKKAYAEKQEAAGGQGDSDEDDVGRGRATQTLEQQRAFKTIRRQLKLLEKLVGRSLREYASRLCDEAILRPPKALSILEGALTQVNNIAEPAKAACNHIWELTGASSEHARGVAMIDPFRQALDVVGDVFNEATNDIADLTSLRRAMERETLAYFRL